MAEKTPNFFDEHPRLMYILIWEFLGVLVDAGTGEDQWVGSQWVCLTGAPTEESVLVEET